MQIHTYRAKTIQEALALVRRELGPDASVLHTREVNVGRLRRVWGGAEVEVAAAVREPEQLGRECSPAPAAVLSRDVEALDCQVERRALDAPTTLFDAFCELLDAGIETRACREILDTIRRETPREELSDSRIVRALVREKVAAFRGDQGFKTQKATTAAGLSECAGALVND